MSMNFLPSFKTPIAVFRLAFMVGIILYFFGYYGLKKTKLNRFIVLYTIFILLLSLLTSDLKESVVDGFVKIAISIFMIPIGIQIGQMRLNALAKPMIWVILLLLVNYGASQFFKLGVSVYDDDSFYKGGATAAAPIIIALGILVIFNSFNKKMLPYSKWITFCIVTAGIFVVLLSVKRGAILALAMGLLIYFFNTSQKATATLRLMIVGAGLLTLTLQYSDLLETRISSRTTERNELRNENRFKETFYVLEELSESNFLQVLFGKEAFNSGVIMTKYFGRARQLHVDYNLILMGTGLVGLFMYFYFYNIIYSQGRKIMKRAKAIHWKTQKLITENNALILGLIILSLTMSISGGIQFVSYRIMLFLLIGYAIGESQGLIQKEQIKQLHENKL